MEKGLLLEHVLPNLKVPQSYEVRLTPITSFGAGDMASRIIQYLERRYLPSALQSQGFLVDQAKGGEFDCWIVSSIVVPGGSLNVI